MRARRFVVEFLPPFVVAVLLLPAIIAWRSGSLWPWHANTIDLQVYAYAVHDMLAGRDIYLTSTPGWELKFIYPPIAAVLMVPLAVGPYVVWQLIWTAILIIAQQTVLRRCGLPRGWKLGLVGVAVVIAMEPLRTTLGYGQINTMLMALVVADLLPDAPGERRRIPRGTLIGLAAALKLTPALFVIFAFMIGRRRLAITAMISFVAFTSVGAIFQWSQTVTFWSSIAVGNTRTAGPVYVGNQSLLGVFARLFGESTGTTLAGLGFSGLVALLGVAVAAHWWRQGHPVFAVALVGVSTCLASPLSWTHHYVWVLPMAVAVLTDRGLPRWLRLAGGFWSVWVSMCLVLAVLPYGGDPERSYNVGQQIVANLTPVLGVAMIIGLAFGMVSRSRSTPSPAGASA